MNCVGVTPITLSLCITMYVPAVVIGIKQRRSESEQTNPRSQFVVVEQALPLEHRGHERSSASPQSRSDSFPFLKPSKHVGPSGTDSG